MTYVDKFASFDGTNDGFRDKGADVVCDRREAAWLEELERQAEIGQRMQWISVADWLPKDGEAVDIWLVDEEFGGERITDVSYDSENMTFSDPFSGDYDLLDEHANPKVTHWMPLPEPPKEAE